MSIVFVWLGHFAQVLDPDFLVTIGVGGNLVLAIEKLFCKSGCLL